VTVAGGRGAAAADVRDDAAVLEAVGTDPGDDLPGDVVPADLAD
jgi:hypothetical protein